MKNIFFLTTLTISLIFLAGYGHSENGFSKDCNYGIHILLEFESYESNEIVSKYQFPDFKEDNVLQIKNIEFVNAGNCTLPKSTIDFKVLNPDKSQSYNFCSYNLELPEIKIVEIYKIFKSDLINYKDTFNNSLRFCGFILDKTGKWSVEYVWQPKDINDYGSTLFIDKSYLDEFNVHSRFDIRSLEISNDSSSQSHNSLLVSIIALILAGISLWVTHLKGPDIKMFFDKDDLTNFKALDGSSFVNNPIKIKLKATVFNEGTRPGIIKSIKISDCQTIPTNLKKKVTLELLPLDLEMDESSEKTVSLPCVVKESGYRFFIFKLILKSKDPIKFGETIKRIKSLHIWLTYSTLERNNEYKTKMIKLELKTDAIISEIIRSENIIKKFREQQKQ